MSAAPSPTGVCQCCGERRDMRALDAKPKALAGYRGADQPQRLEAAAERGVDFDFLACERCYGPGYESLIGGDA